MIVEPAPTAAPRRAAITGLFIANMRIEQRPAGSSHSSSVGETSRASPDRSAPTQKSLPDAGQHHRPARRRRGRPRRTPPPARRPSGPCSRCGPPAGSASPSRCGPRPSSSRVPHGHAKGVVGRRSTECGTQQVAARGTQVGPRHRTGADAGELVVDEPVERTRPSRGPAAARRRRRPRRARPRPSAGTAPRARPSSRAAPAAASTRGSARSARWCGPGRRSATRARPRPSGRSASPGRRRRVGSSPMSARSSSAIRASAANISASRVRK